MTTERITFTGHDGSDLAARLDLPDGPHLATALFAHCFTCSKDIPAARRIASRLAASGIAVLRFDFTGLGHSDGEFANTNFSSNVQDLVLAAEYLASRDMAPSVLIGHSLGGAAVLKAAGDIPSVKAVSTIGAPFDPAHVIHNFGTALDDINKNGQATVDLAGRPFTIRKDFLDDVKATELAPAIATLKRALLVLHAPGDATVGIDNASQIFGAAKHPKSFITLDKADHLITRAEDAEYAAEVICTWASRYLDLPDEPGTPSVPEGVVRVSEADPNGFMQDVSHGPAHHTVADEPIKFGGTNKGMTPYGFVAAGLGACTSMTIRMYARRKGWPLTHVFVDVTHDKIHAQDADAAGPNKVDTFTRTITLQGGAGRRTTAKSVGDCGQMPGAQNPRGAEPYRDPPHLTTAKGVRPCGVHLLHTLCHGPKRKSAAPGDRAFRLFRCGGPSRGRGQPVSIRRGSTGQQRPI